MNATNFIFITTLLLVHTHGVSTFSNPVFQETPTLQRTAPSSKSGVDIELPDFDELFGRIQHVSPLAKSLIGNHDVEGKKGFAGADTWSDNLKWKNIESNERKIVQRIDKIDNFDGNSAPLLRFRSSMKGPCIGECFARFTMDLEERKKWDSQIEQVYELYPIFDLDTANIAMGFGRYGDCSRLGIGYCQTKANLGITPREQLTLCGIQDFVDGSCIIWGVEMEDRHDYLLPPGVRHTRARSHLFATTMRPTGPDSFDIEYVLQLDIGGKIPAWMTAPIVIDSVKGLFKTSQAFFAGSGGDLDVYLAEKEGRDEFSDRHSILMTP